MGQILKNWRVLIATSFALVLIVGSFMLARGVESPSLVQASTETALLQAIATKDSDNDGLPDWEEALYGTSPNVTDTFHLGMTDGAAVAKGLIVPKAIADIGVATSTRAVDSTIDYTAAGLTAPIEGTLTDAFAKKFFTLYLAAKQANGGNDLSEADTNTIENQALNSLAASITAAPDFKSARDLTISGSGTDALKAFAADAEAVFKKNASNATTNELVYLQHAVDNTDTTALAHLAAIAKSFRDSAAGLAALPVPQELAAADLALINAMMRISEIDNDFAGVNVDPLTAMLALQQFIQAELTLGEAFGDVGTIYATAGVVVPSGSPGATFVSAITNAATRQQAALNL